MNYLPSYQGSIYNLYSLHIIGFLKAYEARKDGLEVVGYNFSNDFVSYIIECYRPNVTWIINLLLFRRKNREWCVKCRENRSSSPRILYNFKYFIYYDLSTCLKKFNCDPTNFRCINFRNFHFSCLDLN